MTSLTYKYLVIEDDTNVWNNIEKRMTQYPDWEAVGFTSEINEAIGSILLHKPHLIFSDWSIIGGNAFQILDQIKAIEHYEPYIIFFTGFQSEHPEIPQTIMNDYSMVKKYLVKPIYENLTNNLSTYLDEAIVNHNESLQNVAVFIENQFKQKVKIIPKDCVAVVQCEDNPRNKILYLKSDEKIVIKQTWEQVHEFLEIHNIDYFICHNRKSVINVSSITKISKPFLWLENGMKIKVSRERWDDVLGK